MQEEWIKESRLRPIGISSGGNTVFDVSFVKAGIERQEDGTEERFEEKDHFPISVSGTTIEIYESNETEFREEKSIRSYHTKTTRCKI